MNIRNKCKAYTSLEQSKRLAEILPIESADSYYSWHDERYYVVNKDCPYPYSLKEKIPCWSLDALLDILPYPSLAQHANGLWSLTAWVEKVEPYSVGGYDNKIDSCVEMITKLHELKLL